jgi:DNA-binding transcriptional MerR regulator
LDKTTPSYNLNVVVRETGIKPDTLRAWERRYGLPNPMRTEGGHRLYSDRDIEMIKWFISKQDEGMRISQVVQMWKEMTADGVDPLTPTRQVVDIQPVVEGLPDGSALVQLRNAWIEACLSYDEFGAEQILAQSFARYPVDLVVIEVLQKGLAQIGEGWYEGTVTVQQEHFTSALALRRINALISAAPAPTHPERILVGTPPGEQHVFSPLMLVLFLRYHGWDVTYLGANVPLEDIEPTINQVAPDLVIFTATMLTTAAALLQVAKFLAGQNINFAFGGRAFTENDALHKFVPGYFLGESLQGVVQTVAEILDGKHTPNEAVKPDNAYKQTFEKFKKMNPTINAHVVSNYYIASEYVELIEMVNQQFSGTIQAGLAFGDLSLITPELAWADTLIENNQMSGHLIDEYLSFYRKAVEQELGKEGEILVNWLEHINFS